MPGMTTDTDHEAMAALPAGDIVFDGTHLSIGGTVLTPGRYRVGDEAVLTVQPVDEHDQDDVDG